MKIFLKQRFINKEKSQFKKKYLNKMLPMDINLNNFYFLKGIKANEGCHYLIIFVSEKACGKCLSELLGEIKRLKEKIEQKNIVVLTIFSYSNIIWGEKEIIHMYRNGQLIGPVSIIDKNKFNGLFNVKSDIICFYMNKNFKIKDIFISGETEEFKKWIKNIFRNC